MTLKAPAKSATSVRRAGRQPLQALALWGIVVYGARAIPDWWIAMRPVFVFVLLSLLLVQIGLLVRSVLSLVRYRTAKQLAGLLLALVVAGAGWLAPSLPSRTEMRFWRQRIEFERYVREARVGQTFQVVGTPPGHSIVMPDGQAIEFVVDGDFYLPLVFVANDDPSSIHDTCSHGGSVVRKLAPGWYVCSRDWN